MAEQKQNQPDPGAIDRAIEEGTTYGGATTRAHGDEQVGADAVNDELADEDES